MSTINIRRTDIYISNSLVMHILCHGDPFDIIAHLVTFNSLLRKTFPY